MAANVKRGHAGAAGRKSRPVSSRKKSIIAESLAVWRDKSMGYDAPLFWLIIALLCVGIVMMYSASYAYAYYYEGNSNYYVINQLKFAVLGVVMMLVVSLVPPEQIKRFTMPILGLSYLLLIVVLFLPKIEGVHRWINLGITTFQPSEITKFAIILFGAYWGAELFTKNRKCRQSLFSAEGLAFRIHNLPNSMMGYLLVLGSTAALLILEPHLSCTILVLLLGATVMWVGGVDKKWFIILFVVAAAGMTFVIFSGKIGYSSSRIDVWLDPFSDPLNKGWQNIQALYAISSGGLLGQGLGNSRQKYLYISEPQNDFVFAVVCEELGFVGAVLIILLFLAFVWRGFTISISAPDRFSRLLGIGITAQVGWQALLNIAVVTKTIPNTGISLPFFSSGGTALVMLLLQMGVLLSISRRSTYKKI